MSKAKSVAAVLVAAGMVVGLSGCDTGLGDAQPTTYGRSAQVGVQDAGRCGQWVHDHADPRYDQDQVYQPSEMQSMDKELHGKNAEDTEKFITDHHATAAYIDWVSGAC